MVGIILQDNIKNAVIKSETVIPLESVGENSPFSENGSGGRLFVPRSLIQSYESDITWRDILVNPNNSTLQFEGSQYDYIEPIYEQPPTAEEIAETLLGGAL